MLKEIEADLNEQYINVQDHTEKSEWLYERDRKWRAKHNMSAAVKLGESKIDEEESKSFWGQELKEFYVAGTRAKRALVIYESTDSYEVQVLNDFMNLG